MLILNVIEKVSKIKVVKSLMRLNIRNRLVILVRIG